MNNTNESFLIREETVEDEMHSSHHPYCPGANIESGS